MHNPGRTELPPDCPPGALYIRNSDEGGSYWLNPITPFPIVIEGGEGDDQVHVIGKPRGEVMIDGGPGNDRVVLQDRDTFIADRLAQEGVVFPIVVLLMFAGLLLLIWRVVATLNHRTGSDRG